MTEFLLKPKLLQIELSSFCNALCLGCHRTNTKNYNSVRSSIPKNKIVSVETFTKLLYSHNAIFTVISHCCKIYTSLRETTNS